MESHSSVPYSSSDSSPTINSCSIEALEDHAIDESNTLFLGDLPPSATAQQISDLFPDFEVSHVEIKIINSVKGSLCYAFVTFATAGNSIAHNTFVRALRKSPNPSSTFSTEYAQQGIEKYDSNQALFPDGTVVRVGWAKRNSRLHVSNLDENTTEKDLIELFSR
jgi:RNA recognition motif-containing protein